MKLWLFHFVMASLVMRRRMMKHSLLTIFADTSEGGGLNVLLQENGSALLQEDSSYLILE